jgi:hypothetical protein
VGERTNEEDSTRVAHTLQAEECTRAAIIHRLAQRDGFPEAEMGQSKNQTNREASPMGSFSRC